NTARSPYSQGETAWLTDKISASVLDSGSIGASSPAKSGGKMMKYAKTAAERISQRSVELENRSIMVALLRLGGFGRSSGHARQKQAAGDAGQHQHDGNLHQDAACATQGATKPS